MFRCNHVPPPCSRQNDSVGAPVRGAAAGAGQQAGHPGLHGRAHREAYLQPERASYWGQGHHADGHFGFEWVLFLLRSSTNSALRFHYLSFRN